MFRNKNRHSLQPVKKQVFSMNAEDFPDIAPSSASASGNDVAKPQKITHAVANGMDFKNCYKPPSETIVENNREPGWLYGFGEKNPHHIWFENYERHVVEIEKMQNINDDSPSMEELITEYCVEWERYKEEYIELYGYDEYEKRFISLQMNYQDDDMQMDYEEDEDENDEDELYDEYGDVYDDPYYYK
jgi:hypothetical protein